MYARVCVCVLQRCGSLFTQFWLFLQKCRSFLQKYMVFLICCEPVRCQIVPVLPQQPFFVGLFSYVAGLFFYMAGPFYRDSGIFSYTVSFKCNIVPVLSQQLKIEGLFSCITGLFVQRCTALHAYGVAINTRYHKFL